MHEKPSVLEKFRKLVITGEEEGWDNEDFWNVFKTDSTGPLKPELIQGVTNRPLILRRKQNTTT